MVKKNWIDSNVEVFVSWKTGDGNWFFPCGDRSNCYMNHGKLLVIIKSGIMDNTAGDFHCT
ncbi:MAG: hypothetical protein F6K18_15530 [Okeania sp. SIO2C2]|uniref:hypothetical protein n=1 Tax=Okeania sp. SIO2C2 TaxID=2607787 RepID=UPI0013BAFCF5|nr:hypothetical protein [Okeania sp. SIO2C2]NEP88127.1 hypothetical protein [Okeania sp. SIO2C2]